MALNVPDICPRPGPWTAIALRGFLSPLDQHTALEPGGRVAQRGLLGGFQLNELEMAVIFVSTGVSTGLMVDKMMKVAPGGLVVPLLPNQTHLRAKTRVWTSVLVFL